MPKNKNGRPTIYSQEILDNTIAYYLRYFKAEPAIELTFINSKGKEIKETKINPDYFNPPYIEELALELEVNDDTINEWTKHEDRKEFSATIKKIKILQKLRLLRATMVKTSTTGSIFQLKVNHDMIETEKKVVEGGFTIVIDEALKK